MVLRIKLPLLWSAFPVVFGNCSTFCPTVTSVGHAYCCKRGKVHQHWDIPTLAAVGQACPTFATVRQIVIHSNNGTALALLLDY